MFILITDLAVKRYLLSRFWSAKDKDKNTWKAIMNFLMKAALGGECIVPLED